MLDVSFVTWEQLELLDVRRTLVLFLQRLTCGLKHLILVLEVTFEVIRSIEYLIDHLKDLGVILVLKWLQVLRHIVRILVAKLVHLGKIGVPLDCIHLALDINPRMVHRLVMIEAQWIKNGVHSFAELLFPLIFAILGLLQLLFHLGCLEVVLAKGWRDIVGFLVQLVVDPLSLLVVQGI